MSKLTILREEFHNLFGLVRTLESRQNNDVMREEHSSSEGSEEFTGTSSYKEATDLLRDGYTEVVPKIIEGMKKSEKNLPAELAISNKCKPVNSVVGYIPNVPNAIQNLPESMIDIIRNPQKMRTLDIIYAIGFNCNTDKQLAIDSGIALMTAIKVLESKRISVKLTLCFMASRSGDQVSFPTILLKGYGQRLDIQKLSFPMIHPSIFRRIGFKWLETTPQDINSGFNWGYGHSPFEDTQSIQEVRESLELDSKTKFITCQEIRDMEFNPAKILEFFKNK